MDKTVASAADAIADITDGSTSPSVDSGCQASRGS